MPSEVSTRHLHCVKDVAAQPRAHEAAPIASCRETPCYSLAEIECYLRCPLSYRFKHLERLRPAENLFGVVATSLREAVLYWYGVNQEYEDVGTAGDVVELFRSLVAVKGFAARASKLVCAAEPAILSYLTRARAGEAPLSNEKTSVGHQYTIRFDGENWRLTGCIPLLAPGNTPLELKVYMNGKNEDDASNDLRLSAHAVVLAAELQGGIHAESFPGIQVGMDVLVIGRKPRAQFIRVMKTSAEIRRFMQVATLAADGISKGAFPPRPPGSWRCSPKWCGYYAACVSGDAPPLPSKRLSQERL